MCFLQGGSGERLKGGWHQTMKVLALGACAYNAAAFALRREPHLAANALIYGALVALEQRHVQHHRERVR